MIKRVTLLLAVTGILASISIGNPPDDASARPSSSRGATLEQTKVHTDFNRIRLIAEGTFFVQKNATLTAPENATIGDWKAVIEHSPSARPIPEMRIIPNTHLVAFTTAVRPREDGLQVVLSGRVFVYRGENHLLLTSVPRVTVLSSGESGRKEESALSGAKRGERTTPFDPEDELDSMKRSDPASTVAVPREQQSTEADAFVAKSTPAAASRIEGTVIVDRTTRCILDSEDRAQMLSFDADSDGLQDPPVRLAPCRLLERMENLTKQRGDSVRFVVSGQILNAEGSVLLLLSSFRVPYERDNLSPAITDQAGVPARGGE